jgi:hypothetical protein
MQRAIFCFVCLFFLAKPALPQGETPDYPDMSDAQNQQVRSVLQSSATQWKNNMYGADVQLPFGGSVGAAVNAACLGNVNAVKQMKKKAGDAYLLDACAIEARDLLGYGYLLLAVEWDDRGCSAQGDLTACKYLGVNLKQIGDIAWRKNNKQAAIKIWHASCDDYSDQYACLELKYQAEENIDLDATKEASNEARQAARDQYDAVADAPHQSGFLSVLEAVNQGLSAATTPTSTAPQGADPIQQTLNQQTAGLNQAVQVASQNAQQQDQNPQCSSAPTMDGRTQWACPAGVPLPFPGNWTTSANGVRTIVVASTAPSGPTYTNLHPPGGPNTITGTGLPPTNPPPPSNIQLANDGSGSCQACQVAANGSQNCHPVQCPVGVGNNGNSNGGSNGSNSNGSGNAANNNGSGGGNANGNGRGGSNGSSPGNFVAPLYNCLNTFYDPAEYDWFAFQNTCSIAISTTHIGMNGGGSGTTDSLGPGQHDSTGYSKSEVDGFGGFDWYVCPAGYDPVDANGHFVTAPHTPFHCKQR